MDDRRIEHALREGPPDEPAYVLGVARTLAEPETADAVFEGPAVRDRRTRREARDGRRGPGRAGWMLPLAAVVTVAVVGFVLQSTFRSGGPPGGRDLLASIRADGVIRIAVSNEAPQTQTSGGAYTGFDIDVTRAIAGELDVRAELHLLAPGAIVQGDGDWELALPSSLLPKRLVGADAGAAYYDWPGWIVVEAESSVTLIGDLDGRRICVVPGTPGEAVLAGRDTQDQIAVSLQMPIGASTVLRPNDSACLTALADGEADAAVTSTILDVDFASRDLRAIGVTFLQHRRRVLIRDVPELGDPTSLGAAVDAAIHDLRASGALSDLSRRAFGGEDLAGAIP